MGSKRLGDQESPVRPPYLSPGSPAGTLKPGYCSKGDYCSGAELKKITGNERLAELALVDPKRAKRILANRLSAARSKERKVRYVAELEHKVKTLQTETTALSRRLSLLQRDSAELTSENNGLKLRIRTMEHEAQLRDALKEALTLEVHRLLYGTAKPSGTPKVCLPLLSETT